MKDRLIKNYINKLTINDINNFAYQNGILLNEYELDYVYKLIKNNWYILIYGDATNIFNELKSKVNNETYTKIERLYKNYKEKFKNYL